MEKDMIPKPEEIRKILVVNLGGIGDLLISTPALRGLKNSFPAAKLYLMVVPRAREAVSGLAYVDKVIVFEVRQGWMSMLPNLLTILGLRKEKIDLAINMRTLVSDRSARKIKFILEMIAPRLKAGRDTSGRGKFFDIKVPETDIGDKYEMEYDLEIVRALGGKAEDERIDLDIGREAGDRVDKILNEKGIKDHDLLVGIHPGGKPSHRWPLDKFSRVMKLLEESAGCKFVITGAGDESGLARSLIKQSGVDALDLTGKMSLKELAALLKKCALYIVNDTGSMHIAAVVGTPLVAIFGPGYFKRYDPRNISARAFVFYKGSNCSPCNRLDCDARKCLEDISAGEVAEAARSLLNRKKDEK